MTPSVYKLLTLFCLHLAFVLLELEIARRERMRFHIETPWRRQY